MDIATRVSDLLTLAPDRALIALAERRAPLLRALDVLLEWRRGLLLSDAGASVLAALDAEADRDHLEVERLDVASTREMTSWPGSRLTAWSRIWSGAGSC